MRILMVILTLVIYTSWMSFSNKMIDKVLQLPKKNSDMIDLLVKDFSKNLTDKMKQTNDILSEINLNKIYELHNATEYISGFTLEGAPLYNKLITRNIKASKVVDIYEELMTEMKESYDKRDKDFKVMPDYDIMPDRELVLLPIDAQPDAILFDGHRALKYISLYPELKAYDIKQNIYTFPKKQI